MSERFDRYKDSHAQRVEESISFIGRGVDFFTEAKADHLLALLERRLGDPMERSIPRKKSKDLLAGTTMVEEPYILFFPWRGTLFRVLERGLTRVPLGARYFVTGRKT